MCWGLVPQEEQVAAAETESSAITAVPSLATAFTQSCPCHVIRSNRGLLRLQASSSSTWAACLRQRDCKGGSMKNRSPFLEGGAGALLCCLSQLCPPAAFPADRSRERGAGAVQTPCPHRRWGGAETTARTRGAHSPAGRWPRGRGCRSPGKARRGRWTCPAHVGDRGFSSRLLSGEDVPSLQTAGNLSVFLQMHPWPRLYTWETTCGRRQVKSEWPK